MEEYNEVHIFAGRNARTMRRMFAWEIPAQIRQLFE